MDGAVALRHYSTLSDRRLARRQTEMTEHGERGRRQMPQTGASFRACHRSWRSFCEDLTRKHEKASRGAGAAYMHVVILGTVGSSPWRTQTYSALTYGQEPVYLQHHHLDPN